MKSQELAFPPCDGGNSQAHTTNHPAPAQGDFTQMEMEGEVLAPAAALLFAL